MSTSINLQAAATIGLLAAIATSEIVGLALSANAGSSWLWYLNRSVFESLRPGVFYFSDLIGLRGLSLIVFLAAIMGLVLVAAFARKRLVTGIGANLAVIFCIAFFKLWYDGKAGSEVASLGGFMAASSDQSLLWTLTALAVLASLSMHYSYLRRALPRPRRRHLRRARILGLARKGEGVQNVAE